jgi:hypothetical protein
MFPGATARYCGACGSSAFDNSRRVIESCKRRFSDALAWKFVSTVSFVQSGQLVRIEILLVSDIGGCLRSMTASKDRVADAAPIF